MAKVTVEDLKSFDEFLKRVLHGGAIRVIKLVDYGFTAPVEKGGAIVVQPSVRIVITAFDKKSNKIYRWQEHTDAADVAKTDNLRQRLQLEGFMVEKGEWTQKEIERLLGRPAA